MSASRFMGQAVSFGLGVGLFRVSLAAYKGSHDARVALVSVAITGVALAFAFWCYWGEDK